jgi:DNA polymerase I
VSNIKDLLSKIVKKPPRKRNDHVLIVDAMNTFIRSFSMVKAMNPKGHHIGGLLGFMRSLGFLVRTIDPTRVILVFDGKGGSMNRRNMNPNYKANRDNLKVTHWGMYDSREEERESMAAQMGRLFDYLECMPVSILSLEKVEADDIISFVAQGLASVGRKATIVSSDKDFLQIVKPGIEVYAPIKKRTFTHENILEEIKVSSVNYLIAKALLGDNSDNLRGIKGLGIKTLIKEFPELKTPKKIELDFIYERAEEKLEEKKIFARIVHDWDHVEVNYKIMNLQETQLDLNEKTHIMDVLNGSTPGLNTGTFLYYLEKDEIPGITKNTEGWLETFRPLTISE